MFEKRLKDFFSVYDAQGTFHNGFLQSIDLSAYTDLDILNEITLNIMDAFLKNEIGNMRTQHSWNTFLNWDKDTKKYIINAEFYNSAKYTIYAYLLKSQKFFELLNTDFRSLSAQETEQIVYGANEEENNYDKVVVNVERENDTTVYGAEQLTLNYGAFETETEFGSTRKDYNFGVKETETEFGNTRKDYNFGAKETETEFGNTSETFSTGQQTNSSTTTNQTHPYDAQTFIDDTKNSTSTTNGARQDSKTATTHTDTITEKTHADYETNATHTDTITEKTHADYETNATHTDTVTEKTHEDTEITATHTDTNTFGDITNTTDERKDTSLIKTHTDTKTKTKIILISPEKYYEIMKELMQYNVYDILIGAIKDCFTTRTF